MLAEYQALDFVDRVFPSFMDNFVTRCHCHLFLTACEEMYARDMFGHIMCVLRPLCRGFVIVGNRVN